MNFTLPLYWSECHFYVIFKGFCTKYARKLLAEFLTYGVQSLPKLRKSTHLFWDRETSGIFFLFFSLPGSWVQFRFRFLKKFNAVRSLENLNFRWISRWTNDFRSYFYRIVNDKVIIWAGPAGPTLKFSSSYGPVNIKSI